MHTLYIYHTTSTQETLASHGYICTYADPYIKDIIHQYKFASNTHSKEYLKAYSILSNITLDVCSTLYMSRHRQSHTAYIYTSPPSTMYARKEKDVDSMFFLLKQSMKKLQEYVVIPGAIYTVPVFGIYLNHIKQKKAQHIGGTRSIRTKNLHARYYVSFVHKLRLMYLIHIRKHTHLSYVIIDDVSSTGATLVACKQTLVNHLEYVQKRYPHIRFDVEICSLCH